MSDAPQLQSVLDRIDAISITAPERLSLCCCGFKSIAADPAFAGDCKAGGRNMAKDLSRTRFCHGGGRPTAGNPAIVAKTNGNGNGQGKVARDSSDCSMPLVRAAVDPA